MKVILPSYRASLTKADIAFLCSVFLPDNSNDRGLMLLLADSEERDKLLDRGRLFHAILERPQSLMISPYLYFYVLSRHVLREVDIDSRDVSDYVASVLSQFIRSDRLGETQSSSREALFYAVDMSQQIQAADAQARFYQTVQLANLSLYWVGLCEAQVEHRCQYRAAPPVEYYSSIGRASYEAAGRHHLASEYQLESVFAELGEQFDQAKRALNHMAESLVFLNGSDGSIDTLLN